MRAGAILALVLLSMVATKASLRAQAVLGRVVDDGTGAPVSWAEVVLLDAAGDTLDQALADSTGWFLFHPRGPGPYELQASRIGYMAATVGEVRLSRSFEAVTLEVRLAASAIALEPLRVIAEPRDRWLERAGFYRRRQDPGVFLTPLQIEARQAVFTEDLLRGIPNVTVHQVLGGKVIWMGRGGCPPAVYIQGQLQADLGFLPLLDPKAIRGIEVYRGSSEMPVEYSGAGSRGTTCGAVLFWLY
jgi:hypothetical protein